MKHLFNSTLLLCTLLLLTACGSDGGADEELYTPQTYSKNIEIPYGATVQTVTLDGLNAKPIVRGATNWLQIEEYAYTSGTPSVKIIVSENLTLEQRKAYIVASIPTGDKFILNVTQQPHPAETDTDPDDTHDNTSDKPAWAPQGKVRR